MPVWMWHGCRSPKRDALPCVVLPPSSLTSDQGLDLMERLTQRLSLHAADLTQLSYVQHRHPCCLCHTHNGSPHSLQDIHRIKDNWARLKHLKTVLFCTFSLGENRVKVVQSLRGLFVRNRCATLPETVGVCCFSDLLGGV